MPIIPLRPASLLTRSTGYKYTLIPNPADAPFTVPEPPEPEDPREGRARRMLAIMDSFEQCARECLADTTVFTPGTRTWDVYCAAVNHIAAQTLDLIALGHVKTCARTTDAQWTYYNGVLSRLHYARSENGLEYPEHD